MNVCPIPLPTHLPRTRPGRTCSIVVLILLTLLLPPSSLQATPAAELPLPHVLTNGAPLRPVVLPQGSPSVSLSAATPLAGAPPAATTDNATPRTLAAGDFDQDGWPDVLAGYATPDGGLLALYRSTPALRAAPLLHSAPTRVPTTAGALVPLATAPDWLATGDFDGNGTLDIVAATRDTARLLLLRGDGAGTFAGPQTIALAGNVTALISADSNRPDGLHDILVAIADAQEQAALLVFAAPTGALHAQPEWLPLPAAAGALAVGRFDHDLLPDIVAAAGRELVLFSGRDRKLSHQASIQATVPTPTVKRYYIGATVQALAVGNFLPATRTDLALLDDTGAVLLATPQADRFALTPLALPPGFTASQIVRTRVSSQPTDTLLALEAQGTRAALLLASDAPAWHMLAPGSAPTAVLPLRLNSDALTDLVLLDRAQPTPHIQLTQATNTYTVTEATDEGNGLCGSACTLRDAIVAANRSSGSDVISFAIDRGPQTIDVRTELPALTDAVLLDGTSQPGYEDRPLIAINGSSLGLNLSPLEEIIINGLVFQSDSNVIQGIAVESFPGNGVVLQGNNNIVRTTYIGTNSTGQERSPNNLNGLLLLDSAENVIGGTDPTDRNIFAANGRHGLLISGIEARDNRVQGNFLGVNRFGTTTETDSLPELGNLGAGMFLEDAPANTIGGTTPGAGNVLSGNSSSGIVISRSNARFNLVQGNMLGTDHEGVIAIANDTDGITIDGAPDTLVGGPNPDARNIIGGNTRHGVLISDSTATNNLVQGNLIGLDRSGTAPLGNREAGIDIQGASNTLIGGIEANAANVVSGNAGVGIRIRSSNATSNQIHGNLIGTDMDGQIGLGNARAGVSLDNAPDNVVGGTDPATRNLISGNGAHGVSIEGISAVGNRVQGNLIGVNREGTLELGNGDDGVFLANASRNLIGGRTAEAQNIISGNRRNGVNIQGPEAEGNRIEGNVIGLDVNSELDLGNLSNGIILIASLNTEIGGTDPGAGNVIAGNAQNGILSSLSTAQIRNNQIRSSQTGVQIQDGEITIVGNEISQNSVAVGMGLGTLRLYANNITAYEQAFSDGGGTFRGEHNWWGRATGSSPTGLDVRTWNNRLFAPVQAFAAGSDQVELDGATLSGSTGTAIIVAHDRTAFDQGEFPLSERLCSLPYDFFVVDGGGLWEVSLPIDDTPACANVHADRQVYWMNAPQRCVLGPAHEGCWELIEDGSTRRVLADGQRLVVDGLLTSDLGGTLIAAGTIIEPETPLLPYLAGVLVLAGVVVFVVWWWWRRTAKSTTTTA